MAWRCVRSRMEISLLGVIDDASAESGTRWQLGARLVAVAKRRDLAASRALLIRFMGA